MNKKNILIICLFIVSILVSWNLFKPGFFAMDDDLQIMRLYEMKQCLNDGQIPCRWASEMSAGYGQPMFNYYSATPYYLGALFNNLGFSFLTSIKIIFFISISLGGIAMFLLLSELLPLLPSFIGGIAYILVPYRALDVFVRGALSENFALALLPIVLFSVVRLIKNKSKFSFILLSISLGLFLATHNITTLISAPLILIFTIVYFLINKNNFKDFIRLVISVFLGVGVAAFFILPVIFESKLINTSFLTSNYLDFHAHFATLKQLFISQKWGFGSSVFGPNDDMSFAVGIIQTLAFLLAPIILFFKKNIKLNLKIIISLFWIFGMYYLFLTTARSVINWELLPILSYVQFPWRFLGIVAICSSVILGAVISLFKEKIQKVMSIIIVLLLFLLNFSFFKFEKNFETATENTYLSGSNYTIQQKSALLDYLPLSMKKIPSEIAPANPRILSGQGSVNNFQKRSAYFSADVEIYTKEPVVVAFPITYFPNWTIYIDSSIIPTPFTTDNDYGEITLTFTKKLSLVQGYFENTPIRTIANFITFFSLLILLVVALKPDDKKDN